MLQDPGAAARIELRLAGEEAQGGGVAAGEQLVQDPPAHRLGGGRDEVGDQLPAVLDGVGFQVEPHDRRGGRDVDCARSASPILRCGGGDRVGSSRGR